jgi:NitT/TauT family transport system substrate-binding protein
MAAIWPQHQFSLTLDQGLVAAMEDEARWMIEHDLAPEENVPNFLDYIYIDGLEVVKPDAVNVIH